MHTARRFPLLAAASLIVVLAGLPYGSLGAADEPIDYASLARIRAEGLQPQNSQVMDIASWLTDVHGPRLSGSPGIRQAGEWAVAEMKKWGLENVALEPWSEPRGFDRGWSNDRFYMAATSPQAFPIHGTPRAWTPGTNGPVTGQAVLITETDEAGLQKYAGKLKGAFVLGAAPPDVAAWWEPSARRYTREELDQRETPAPAEFGVSAPGGRGGRGGGRGGAGGPAFNRDDFFRQQGVAMVLSTNGRGHGIYTIGGANRSADPATLLPQVTIPGRGVRPHRPDAAEGRSGHARSRRPQHLSPQPGDVRRRRRDSRNRQGR